MEKDVFYTQRQIREGMSEMRNTQKRESDRASSAVKLHELNISKSTLNFNIALGMDKVFEKMSKEFSAVGVEQKSENIESEIETENKRVGSSDNDEPN